jgi:2,4-dienoyl-CoA reductase-like NADH-dependent reductase (Old Yellow Enzyme family)
LENLGVDVLVLSAVFVSRAPMEVMRGAMPFKTLAYYMNMAKHWWLKLGISMVGRLMIPPVPYKEAYFLEDAKKFREVVKLSLIYVGGMVSRNKMEEVLNEGFIAVQIARALVHNTDFVNKLQNGLQKSDCKHSNYCIGRMYTLEMKYHHCVDNLPKKIKKEIDRAEEK